MLLVLSTTLALNWECDLARIMPQRAAGIAHSCAHFYNKRQCLGDSLRRQTQMVEKYTIKNELKLSNKNLQDLGISAFQEVNAPLGWYTCRLWRRTDCYRTNNHYRSIRPAFTPWYWCNAGNGKRDSTQRRSGSQPFRWFTLTKNSLNDLQSVIRIAVAADLTHKASEQHNGIIPL